MLVQLHAVHSRIVQVRNFLLYAARLQILLCGNTVNDTLQLLDIVLTQHIKATEPAILSR